MTGSIWVRQQSEFEMGGHPGGGNSSGHHPRKTPAHLRAGSENPTGRPAGCKNCFKPLYLHKAAVFNLFVPFTPLPVAGWVQR